jgi:anti-repressor protein
MTNASIQPFDFKGTPVRALADKNGNPWLIAKDVCDVLGLNNVTEALRSLDDDEKTNISNSEVAQNGGRDPFIISEAGFYKLVMRSRKPEAKEFQRWVTHEVLPSIRRHGGYMAGQESMTPEQMALASMQWLHSKVEEQAKQLEAQAPKVLFADAVNASQTSILVGQLAKIIQQNGVPMGQRRLFAWLREHHYLSSRKGEDYNMPLQKYIEQGLFEIKESTHTNPDGVTFTTRTVKVTGKGQQYFVNKFLAGGLELAK